MKTKMQQSVLFSREHQSRPDCGSQRHVCVWSVSRQGNNPGAWRQHHRRRRWRRGGPFHFRFVFFSAQFFLSEPYTVSDSWCSRFCPHLFPFFFCRNFILLIVYLFVCLFVCLTRGRGKVAGDMLVQKGGGGGLGRLS